MWTLGMLPATAGLVQVANTRALTEGGDLCLSPAFPGLQVRMDPGHLAPVHLAGTCRSSHCPLCGDETGMTLECEQFRIKNPGNDDRCDVWVSP